MEQEKLDQIADEAAWLRQKRWFRAATDNKSDPWGRACRPAAAYCERKADEAARGEDRPDRPRRVYPSPLAVLRHLVGDMLTRSEFARADSAADNARHVARIDAFREVLAAIEVAEPDVRAALQESEVPRG